MKTFILSIFCAYAACLMSVTAAQASAVTTWVEFPVGSGNAACAEVTIEGTPYRFISNGYCINQKRVAWVEAKDKNNDYAYCAQVVTDANLIVRPASEQYCNDAVGYTTTWIKMYDGTAACARTTSEGSVIKFISNRYCE